MRGGVAAPLLALLLAGCGATSPDLFVLHRTGALPGARLTLLVNDGGTVRCNGRKPRLLPADLLIAARETERDLFSDAQKHRRFPPRPGGLLAYRVRTRAGTIAWSDSSRPLPRRYYQLAFLARRIAQRTCGLAR